jgi:hypothetical protein
MILPCMMPPRPSDRSEDGTTVERDDWGIFDSMLALRHGSAAILVQQCRELFGGHAVGVGQRALEARNPGGPPRSGALLLHAVGEVENDEAADCGAGARRHNSDAWQVGARHGSNPEGADVGPVQRHRAKHAARREALRIEPQG